jgi:WD40 repeat protein
VDPQGDQVTALEYLEVGSGPPRPSLVVARGNRTVEVWDLLEVRQTHCLTGHLGPAKALAVCREHPGGPHRTASGDTFGQFRIWGAESGTLVHTLKGEAKTAVSAVGYQSAEGAWRLVFGGTDFGRGVIEAWDPEEARRLVKAEGVLPKVTCVHLTESERGRYLLLSGHGNGEVRIFDLEGVPYRQPTLAAATNRG